MDIHGYPDGEIDLSGDMVMIDFGGKKDGYNVDMSRHSGWEYS